MAIVTALTESFTELLECIDEISALFAGGDAAAATAASGNSLELFSMTATAGEATGEATTSLTTIAETFGQTASEQSPQITNELFASVESANTSAIATENELLAAEQLNYPITSTPMPGVTQFENVELTELSTIPKTPITPIQTDFLSQDYLMEVEDGGDDLLFLRRHPLHLRSSFTVIGGSSKNILGVSLLAATGTAAATGTVAALSTSTAAAATAVGLGATTSTATTVTAVGSLTAKIVTALGASIGTAATAAVYKVVKTLDDQLPGAADMIMTTIESGKIDISEENVNNWLTMIMSNSSLLAKLRAAGIDVTLLSDGNIAKIGPAIAKALRWENDLQSLANYFPDITTQLHKTSPILRHLNSDYINNLWTAATTA